MYYSDQLSRTVHIPETPSRIISLVPSITELLADLELKEEIKGITKFCVHPKNLFKSKTKIGGTKKVNIKKVHDLNPDLIVANKEENTKSDINELESAFPVWVSDVNNYDDALAMIHALGTITGKLSIAEEIINRINTNFESVDTLPGLSVLYLIWKNPYMACGGGTFIDDMLSKCGFINVLRHKNRYPELNNELIKTLKPDVVLLSDEPYPFKTNDINDVQQLFPSSRVMLTNGEYFSWYGSRMIDAPDYFNQLNSQIINSFPKG